MLRPLIALFALLWVSVPASADELTDAVAANATRYAELHATLKPCTPARDLRDRYLDRVEASFGFAQTRAAQAYDIAYLTAPRGTSNCGPDGQRQVEAGMVGLLGELQALATAQAPPRDPATPPAWVRSRVLFLSFLFADAHAELDACAAAEAGLRDGWLGWVEGNLPTLLPIATARYDATLVRENLPAPTCTPETIAAGKLHLEHVYRDLQSVGDMLAGRLAAPPTWTERLMTTYGACTADAGRRDVNCYCQGEAAANRGKADPAALTGELETPAERRCTEPQAIRLTQYDTCIQLYGAFVDGERRKRAELLCGCVASHVVRHFRELPLPLLRTRAIDACLSDGVSG
ncbi:MAG: hypothetical protein RIM84_25670 [Alphaproteobacteria bacterium]